MIIIIVFTIIVITIIIAIIIIIIMCNIVTNFFSHSVSFQATLLIPRFFDCASSFCVFFYCY